MSGFKKNRTYIEFLRLSEFADINFGTSSHYPQFAVDLLKYITTVDIEAHYRKKELEKKRQAVIDAGLDVSIKPKILTTLLQPDMYSTFDTCQNEKVDMLQKEIDSWKEGMGLKMFTKVFRGFRALCKNGAGEGEGDV